MSSQHRLPPTPANLPLAVRCISALAAVVVLVGLTATATSTSASAKANDAASAQVSAAAQPGAIRQLRPELGIAQLLKARQAAPAVRPAAPVKAAAPAHRPSSAPAKVVEHAPVKRWLPTGTGMWLHEWNKSNGGDAHSILKRARQTGVTTLYVRSGSKKGGAEAPQVLRQLLPATKGTPVKVVLWEFVYLQNPEAEARRLAAAARIHVAGAPHVAAVAPDIETSAEGAATRYPAVVRYLRALRAALPPEIAILGTVPWPSELRVGKFPYQAVGHYADAILPMTYWYNRGPAEVTGVSIRFLRQFHKPIMPVGQGYDGRLDAPWLPPVNLPQQVQSFLNAAKASDAQAVSLWSWQTASPQVWRRLAGSHFAHDGHRPAHKAIKKVVRKAPKVVKKSTPPVRREAPHDSAEGSGDDGSAV